MLMVRSCKVLVYTVIVFVLTVTLVSCEYVGIGIEIGNSTNNYHEATSYLCSRTWVEEWNDSYGNFHRQELRFYSNNTGEDYTLSVDNRGFRQEFTYTFLWDWYDANYTSLRLKYGANDYSYMDNIIMDGNRLNCLLDGYPAYFYGK